MNKIKTNLVVYCLVYFLPARMPEIGIGEEGVFFINEKRGTKGSRSIKSIIFVTQVTIDMYIQFISMILLVLTISQYG